MMKAQELHTKEIDALNDELGELLTEQFKLRMQRANGQLGHPHRFKVIRRDIARIKTVINQRIAATDGNKA